MSVSEASGVAMESQESQASEDCPSDEEDDYYGDYYEGDDVDVITMEGSAPRDAAFQKDPEWYEFSCLSSEEVWNYLDAQVREVGREVKVRCGLAFHSSLHVLLCVCVCAC